MDFDNALKNIPKEVLVKVKDILEKYKKTGNEEYAKLAISILEQFDDSSCRELVRVLSR